MSGNGNNVRHIGGIRSVRHSNNTSNNRSNNSNGKNNNHNRNSSNNSNKNNHQQASRACASEPTIVSGWKYHKYARNSDRYADIGKDKDTGEPELLDEDSSSGNVTSRSSSRVAFYDWTAAASAYDSDSDLESGGSDAKFWKGNHDTFLSPTEDMTESSFSYRMISPLQSSTGPMTNKGKRLSSIDENCNHDARGELGKKSDLKKRREIPTLRGIMFNSDVLRPFPNKEIASNGEEGFFDAKNELSESDRTITYGHIPEPNHDKKDNRVKIVRFAGDEENHLLEWRDPANHHYNNVLRVLPQDPSGVLDIYHEAQDNPFYDSHEGSHKIYSREEFETRMYDDENSSCGYTSEDDILKYDERTVWAFLLSLGSMAIHAVVSTVRKSNNDVPANEEIVMGREIIEDTTHIAELATESAFSTSGGATGVSSTSVTTTSTSAAATASSKSVASASAASASAAKETTSVLLSSTTSASASASTSSTVVSSTVASSTATSSTGAATTAVTTTASSAGATSAVASAGATSAVASTAGATTAAASSAGAATAAAAQ